MVPVSSSQMVWRCLQLTYEKFHGKAIRLAYEYTLKNSEIPEGFSIEDVTIVWFCKTLQNWKAIVITRLPDQLMHEVTYNGDKQETYIDTYKKFDNVRVSD
jgi:hypothetical protein